MKQKYVLRMGSEIHAHRRDYLFESGEPQWQVMRAVKDCLYVADDFSHTSTDIIGRLTVMKGLVSYMLSQSELADLDTLLFHHVYVNLWNYPHAEYDGFLVDIRLLEKYV